MLILIKLESRFRTIINELQKRSQTGSKKNNFWPQFPTKGTNQASIPHKMITNLINYKKQPATLNTFKNSKLCFFFQKDQKSNLSERLQKLLS
jgi:hypothetical protein